MRKRNKKTQNISHAQMTRLTDYILSRMGDEGLLLRQRLEQFLEDRAVPQTAAWGGTDVTKDCLHVE